MRDHQERFHNDIKRVAADARASSNDLLARLKRLTPEEFLRQPPQMIGQLTVKQFREIAAVIAPKVKLPSPAKAEPPFERKSDFTKTKWSATRKAIVAMLVVTGAFSATGILAPLALKWSLSQIEVVRPMSTATWPACSRLSHYTDGCVYTPAQDLNWEWVAYQLGMSVEALRKTNPHLIPHFIPRGAPLAVWRHQGRLEN